MQLAVTARLNGAEVDENVLASFLGDESKALGGVEPLDRSGRCHALILLDV